jgi:hypothetical protein
LFQGFSNGEESGVSKRLDVSRVGLRALGVALLAAGCASRTTLVQSSLPQGISVSGHGEAEGKPDVARATLGIEIREKEASRATERANQLMTAILEAVKQKGVPEADIRTQSFSVNFEPEPYPPGPYPVEPENRPAGPVKSAAAPDVAPGAGEASPRGFYRVSNTVIVTVRKLDDLGAVLGAATAAGANNVWGVQFDIEDPSKLEAEARSEAMAEARTRAEQLARLAGVTLGRVVSVGDSGGGVNRADGYGYSMKAANVPVQSGELTITQDVQVVFSID